MRYTNYPLGLHPEQRYSRRRIVNFFVSILLALAALIALVPLFYIFFYVVSKGIQSLSWDFFSKLPQPVGELHGGMANAILGTGILITLASMIAIPWGIATGIYLSEYGKGKDGKVIRFGIDLLASVPSIVIGLFVYTIVVVTMKRFSAIAGGIALSIIMLPTIARTTEEILKLVPTTIREAGLGLGLPRWKVIIRIVLQESIGPIATGILLAIARVSGETAPLLLTAFNNRFWQSGLDQPIASLPVQIYTYAVSPFEDWHNQAWSGALVLLIFVFTINAFTRYALKKWRK